MDNTRGKGAPPSYESHGEDDVYDPNNETPTTVPHSGHLDTIPQGLREELLLSAEQLLSSGPLSLTLDKDLIYPTEPPSRALYHIPRSLACNGDKVFLERSVPATVRQDGSQGKARDQELYHIVGSRLTSSEIEIRGMRRSCYGDSIGRMRPRHAFFHSRWDVAFRKQTVLRFKNRTWLDANEGVMARERKGMSKPIMVIEQGVDVQMMDLLVACWCAKTWWEWDGKYRDGTPDSKA
ncbi:MAG: hypothetical protein M1835_000004 [Candelina submexicana]|nr:MAG: hypothetical protein M1835_000004 [Candelina submexicana]